MGLRRDIPSEAFLPMFIASRMAGFMAHWREAMSKSIIVPSVPNTKVSHLERVLKLRSCQLSQPKCGGRIKYM